MAGSVQEVRGMGERAVCFETISNKREELMDVASWEDARICLQRLLNSQTDPCGITISNVKRLFRSHFQLELSVTALGHTRLLDVLTDEHLQDICALDAQRNGFMVKRAVPATPPGFWGANSFALAAMPMMPMSMPFLCEEYTAWGESESDDSGELLSPGASPRGPPPS